MNAVPAEARYYPVSMAHRLTPAAFPLTAVAAPETGSVNVDIHGEDLLDSAKYPSP